MLMVFGDCAELPQWRHRGQTPRNFEDLYWLFLWWKFPLIQNSPWQLNQWALVFFFLFFSSKQCTSVLSEPPEDTDTPPCSSKSERTCSHLPPQGGLMCKLQMSVKVWRFLMLSLVFPGKLAGCGFNSPLHTSTIFPLLHLSLSVSCRELLSCVKAAMLWLWRGRISSGLL